MVASRTPQKVERVTVTLIPERDERQPLHVPSTFSREERSYTWKRAGTLEYMIVPTRVSRSEIRLDLFFMPARGAKRESADTARRVENFVRARIGGDWHGVKLGSIGRRVTVAAPRKTYVRGTIEEMLGVSAVDH